MRETLREGPSSAVPLVSLFPARPRPIVIATRIPRRAAAGRETNVGAERRAVLTHYGRAPDPCMRVYCFRHSLVFPYVRIR